MFFILPKFQKNSKNYFSAMLSNATVYQHHQFDT